MPFFVNNFEDTDSIGNMFSVIYDDIELVSYFGELSVTTSENLSFQLKANYRNYTLNKELKAWHKPNFDLNFSDPV
ncbi:MAG: hypothetical protein MZV63_40750 [Marinilabiliales bacterium]|nr:hypothetical protein [Marinilabiliales bacterium]